jgi:hypothetical protein
LIGLLYKITRGMSFDQIVICCISLVRGEDERGDEKKCGGAGHGQLFPELALKKA